MKLSFVKALVHATVEYFNQHGCEINVSDANYAEIMDIYPKYRDIYNAEDDEDGLKWVERQIDNWSKILVDCFDGKIKFMYSADWNVTFISGVDWEVVKDNRNFRLSVIDTVYYKGAIDIGGFTQLVIDRIKILKFLNQK